MTEITVEQYASLKADYDNLKSKYDVLEEKAKTFDDEIKKRDEKITTLNEHLYNSIFTREKPKDSSDDEPKDFTDYYEETLKEMTKG